MSSPTVGPIGLLGVGRMGDPIAARLAASGYEVWFYDPRADAGSRAVRAGARPVATAAALADAAVTVSLLPDPRASLLALTGEHGLLTHAAPDHLHVHMGTVDPATVLQVAAVGPAVADCPLSGSVAHAERGALTAVIGCAPELLPAVEAVLLPFTTHRLRVGDVGAASATKLALNSVTGVYATAVAEALAYATAAGVDLAAAYDVFEHSVMATPFLAYKRGHVFRPDLPPDGPVSMVAKDLDLATASATGAGVVLRCAEAARTRLRDAAGAGAGDADIGILLSLLRTTAGAR